MKPFNPIIGETYQGYWPDGSSIFCEHTSHHPPITNFFVNKFFSSKNNEKFHDRLKIIKRDTHITVIMNWKALWKETPLSHNNMAQIL